MRHSFLFLAGLIAVSFSCQTPLSPESEIFESLKEQNGLSGNKEYLASPFVAAGDRVYLIGHQNGTFPDLGWHVEGEMGGIWLHPIKLMDGFTASIESDGNSFCLDKLPVRSMVTTSSPAGLFAEQAERNIMDSRVSIVFIQYPV